MAGCHSKNHYKNHYKFHGINEFEILGDLGKGGYSVVRLVKHIKTGKKYALKCAMKFKKKKDSHDRTTYKDISERTRQEIEVLSDIRSSKIVKLYGWFEDEEYIYLVLEYISGKDLSKYFKKELPSKEVAKNIMKQIVDSVKYCHHRGIIHRDIKLENVLINQHMKIKLTDFGLSIVRECDDEYFYDEVGTARYTAPELLYGNGYDESIDVWGIGIILFMLLTGKYPFDGSKRKSIFRRIRKKRIDYGKYNLSRTETHLLKRLLCKDSRYRIQLDDISDHSWFYESSDGSESE